MSSGLRCNSSNSEQSLGIFVTAMIAISLAGCSTFSGRDSTTNNTARTTTSRSDSSTQQSAASARGAFYKDDGPGDNPPSDPTALPEPVPRIETCIASPTIPTAYSARTMYRCATRGTSHKRAWAAGTAASFMAKRLPAVSPTTCMASARHIQYYPYPVTPE